MDRIDAEFWNGVQKGLTLALFEVNRLTDVKEAKNRPKELDGVRIAMNVIVQLKNGVETIQRNNLKKIISEHSGYDLADMSDFWE